MHKFGTDGIRGKAEQFTPEFLAKIVKGLTTYAGDHIKIFLAGDTRESTEWILQDLATACDSFGIEYGTAGVLPTPAINYCFYEMGFDFAIDVTASHNPYTDNGIKVFERSPLGGQKLCKKGRTAIESALSSDSPYTPGSPTIREDLHQEALALYQKHLQDYLNPADFKGLHIGLDCANGATSVAAVQIFEHFGAKVTPIHVNKDYNTNINKACGSTHLDSLAALVAKHHLDFGLAFDGDGDRCLAIDANGQTVDGDQMLAFLSDFLELDAIVTTVMAGQGLLNWTKEANIHAKVTDVGDPNVVAAMLAEDIHIGSEQNGHVILPGHTSGDGILTGLMITKAVTATGKTLTELASIITKFPQIIVNISATPEQKQSLLDGTAESLLQSYQTQLTALEGRLLVRPSGTEPLIRITMWGNDESAITALADELKNDLIQTL